MTTGTAVNEEAMLVNNASFRGNISRFPLASYLLTTYCGQTPTTKCRSPNRNALVRSGLDYILALSPGAIDNMHRFYHHLRHEMLRAVDEVGQIIDGRYQVVVGQSLSYGLLDEGAALNGYKSDIDILIQASDFERFKNDLAAAGHHRRVIDCETGNIIQLDDNDQIDFVAGKRMAGTFVMPLTLGNFDEYVSSQYFALAGKHQPLNVDGAGNPYLLFGIDAISSYGSDQIDITRSRIKEGIRLPIQDTNYNISVSIRRLYSVIGDGILKPNLILLVVRMLMKCEIGEIWIEVGQEYQQFLSSLIVFHYNILQANPTILRRRRDYEDAADKKTLETLSALYESLQTYIGDHGE